MKKIILIIVTFVFLALTCNAQILPKTNIVSTNTLLTVNKAGQNFSLTVNGSGGGGSSTLDDVLQNGNEILNNQIVYRNGSDTVNYISLGQSGVNIVTNSTNDNYNSVFSSSNLGTSLTYESILNIDSISSLSLNKSELNLSSLKINVSCDTLKVNSVLKYNTDNNAIESRTNLLDKYIFSNSGDATTTSTVGVVITPYNFIPKINKRYRVRGSFVISNSGTGGVRLFINLPTASSMYVQINGQLGAIGTITRSNLMTSGGLSTLFMTQATNTMIFIEGEIETSINEGTIEIGFASGTTGQTTTIFQRGSFLNYVQLN